jgi:predicted HTH transcriptional regulator
MNTADWTYKELQEFLAKGSSIENDQLEFKERLNIATDREKEELRKDFSALANSSGGYIFVGIDNEKNIVGIPKDDDLLTKINRCFPLSRLSPSINFAQQAVIDISRANPKTCVYIYYIKPSPRHKKPHVSDYKVYVREQGESKPLSSGAQMRELFVLSTFNPEYVDLLEHELEKIRQYEYSFNQIDCVYLKHLEKYLYDLKKENEEKTESRKETNELITLLKEIFGLITEIERLKAEERSASAIQPLSVSSSIRTNYDELAVKVDDFIAKFKKVHQ